MLYFRRDDCSDDDLFGVGGEDGFAGGFLSDGPRLLRVHLIHVHIFYGRSGDDFNAHGRGGRGVVRWIDEGIKTESKKTVLNKNSKQYKKGNPLGIFQKIMDQFPRIFEKNQQERNQLASNNF